MVDRIHRLPRLWSNRELRAVAPFVEGDVVNVSAWKDEDKEGGTYRKYFSRASSYTITNYLSELRGFQGHEGEIFLDLTRSLPSDLLNRFDCVFNHTTLEHIFDFQSAIDNLCSLTNDLLILVVPFLQPAHSNYGDYWRFAPRAVATLVENRGLSVARLRFNNHRSAAVYVFCVASKKPERWSSIWEFRYDDVDPRFPHLSEPFAGCNALPHAGLRKKLRYFVGRMAGLARDTAK